MLNYDHNVPGLIAALAVEDDVCRAALPKLRASFDAVQKALVQQLPTIQRLGRRSLWLLPQSILLSVEVLQLGQQARQNKQGLLQSKVHRGVP